MQPSSSHMKLALSEARCAAAHGEVPVGAVVTDPRSDTVVASAGNRVVEMHDPTAHAELLAIRAAAQCTGSERLEGLDLYVTLEPCAMCAQAASFARIRRLVYGAEDPKGGGVDHGPRIFSQATCHHRPEVIAGVANSEATALLQDFFTKLRDRGT